jgi:hypothetical protein
MSPISTVPVARLVQSLVLLFFLPGIAVSCWSCLLAVGRSSLAAPLAVGAVAGTLFEKYVLRKWPAFELFEHELTHAVAALLWLRPVTRFVVRRHGGFVTYGGGFGGEVGDDFIALAPYVLPTFTAVAVLCRPWLPHDWLAWFDGWIGLAFGYHTSSTIGETRTAWTRRSFQRIETCELTTSDIAQQGFFYSAIYIASVTLAIHGALLAILSGGYAGLGAWARATWQISGRLNPLWAAYLEDAARGVLAVVWR